ncbi:MAG: FMN-binding protein, partial [Eubacteriales bacterium]
MIKDTIILTIITLIAGLSLGVVYNVTKEPIAIQKELAVKNSYLAVYSDADSFEELLDATAPMEFIVNNEIQGVEITSEVLAKDTSGNQIGTILLVTSKEGYAGDISIAMGVTNEGVLNGISILAISETAGLGMKAGEVLVPQFANKKVDQFLYTKAGAVSEEQIDVISGATVTTEAFT